MAARKRKPSVKMEGSSEPSVFNDEDNSSYLSVGIELYCAECRVLAKMSEMVEDKDGFYRCGQC